MKFKYVKYDGYNGFQVYGFVKDNTYKLDMWRVRVKRRLKLFSNKVEKEIYLDKGNYVYIDEYAQYTNQLKTSNHHPFLLILIAKFKKFIRDFNKKKELSKFTNAVSDYMND